VVRLARLRVPSTVARIPEGFIPVLVDYRPRSTEMILSMELPGEVPEGAARATPHVRISSRERPAGQLGRDLVVLITSTPLVNATMSVLLVPA
jgi:hypothetical protein